MIWIYDRDENQIDFLDLNPVFTRELNSINTLEFSSDKEYKKGYRVVYKLDDRFYEFIITEINYSRSDYYTFSYYCEDSIIELRYTIIEDKRPEGDIWTALKVVLEDTRFDYKVINSKDIRHKNSYYRETALKCFLDTVEKYNVDWYTNFSVSNFGVLKREIIIEDRGKITGYRLEFGKNIRTFTREIINEDIITALYGFGKGEEILDENGDSTGGYGRRIDFASINNGKKYVENLEAKARYGIGKKENKSHNYGVVIFEDITDRTELLKATQEELDRVSKVQAEYNVDFLELEEELYNLQIDIGDKVQVIDREINFRDELRVIKIVQENKRKNYTFGNLVKPMSENSVSKITKVEDDLENYVSDFSSSFINVSKKIKENKDYYDSKINDINQEIVDYTNNLSQEIKNAPEVTIEWLKENTGVLPSGVLALDGGLKAGHIEAGAIKTIHHESKSITSELVKFDQAFIDEITSRAVISELGMFGKITGNNGYWSLDTGEFKTQSGKNSARLYKGEFESMENNRLTTKIDSQGIKLYNIDSPGVRQGGLIASKWLARNKYNINLYHDLDSTLTFNYRTDDGTLSPYVVLDRYNHSTQNEIAGTFYPVRIIPATHFPHQVRFDGKVIMQEETWLSPNISKTTIQDNGILLGRQIIDNGFYINNEGALFDRIRGKNYAIMSRKEIQVIEKKATFSNGQATVYYDENVRGGIPLAFGNLPYITNGYVTHVRPYDNRAVITARYEESNALLSGTFTVQLLVIEKSI